MIDYESPTTDDRRIWDLWLASLYQGAIVAADDAGIFSSLEAEPARIPELAARLDFDVRATGILLRLLAALGLLAQREGRFAVTDQTRLFLVKESPYYWGHAMRISVNEGQRTALMQRLQRIGSAEASGPLGTPGVGGGAERAADAWAAGSIPIEQAKLIAAVMHSHSLPAALGAARNYDLSGVSRILDVGGGSGCFMIAMAQRHPALRCTVMELDAMCGLAQAYIEAGGVSDRVETVAVECSGRRGQRVTTRCSSPISGTTGTSGPAPGWQSRPTRSCLSADASCCTRCCSTTTGPSATSTAFTPPVTTPSRRRTNVADGRPGAETKRRLPRASPEYSNRIASCPGWNQNDIPGIRIVYTPPMAYNRSHARSLCSKDEYQLFSASLDHTIDQLTAAQLRRKIERTRRLRDKYGDLYKRQRLATRARTGTKKGERPETNARTEAKARLFDEALQRFEARAAKLATAAEREPKRDAAGAAVETRMAERRKAGAQRAAALGGRKPRGGKAAGREGYASESAHAAARGKLARDTRAGARKGHKSAAGKRSQARRDGRR